MAAPGYLRRMTRMLVEDLEVSDAAEIADESRAQGAQQASTCCRGEQVRIYGELRSVQTCAKGGKSGVVAEFFDGTDTVRLKWLGRSRIPGIEPGRKLWVSGRLGEQDGTKVIFNPYYDLAGD
ncbi:MAG: OB-fold nucleic acid binding domain-containing protein [Gordonia sp. (in: high G+C Gram-positive bacteria)]|uniref:OB-fold nucleic acid binding domain-containing protein n=1 Tax=Gordonia sp. (in: high G+C Gram-positive bacteria) TaxID=84139 RepID=UPI0039E67761